MKRYSGIQPQYFPRLHYFARIMATDIFMVRDDVQFVRHHKYPDGTNGFSYQAHSPIKSSMEIYYLVIPIAHEGLTPIFKTHISDREKWTSSHVQTIKSVYGKAPNFEKIFPQIKSIIEGKHESLLELNLKTILWGVLNLLGEKEIKDDMLSLDSVNQKLSQKHDFRLKEIRLATSLKSFKNFTNQTANEKILSILKELGATEDYCGGTAMSAYVDESLFEKEGIKITVQDWKCQKYPQLFEDKLGFIPNLSIIDLLMNVDHKKAVEIING